MNDESWSHLSEMLGKKMELCWINYSNPALHSKVAKHRPIHATLLLSGRHQAFHSCVNNVRVAQCPTNSPCRIFVISRVPGARIKVPRRLRFDSFRAHPDAVLPTERPHRVPHARVAISPTDFAQDADVVGADVQDATLPVGQPTRERVEKRKGRDVLIVKIIRFVPKGAHVAAGYPAVAGDDELQLVLLVWSSGSDFIVPWKFGLGGSDTAARRCARARLLVGGTLSERAQNGSSVKGFKSDCSHGHVELWKIDDCRRGTRTVVCSTRPIGVHVSR